MVFLFLSYYTHVDQFLLVTNLVKLNSFAGATLMQHQYMSQKLALLDAQMAKMLTTHRHTRELLKK